MKLIYAKKKRFELEIFTDDQLTTSFSHRFNSISGSEQTKEKSSQQLLTFNKYLFKQKLLIGLVDCMPACHDWN
jgi:hypothetical protein